MRHRYKIFVGAGAVLGITALGGLFALGAIARDRGVTRIELPSGSLVEAIADGADYVDSYAAAVPATFFPNVEMLDHFAFQRGAVVGRTDEEVLYTGNSPGLTFYISYRRHGNAADMHVAVTTVVHYQNWRGWLYFAAVRPVHRVLAPFMLSVMIRRAEAAAQQSASATAQWYAVRQR